jgi:F-type H+-transporting ATPase subunit b
MFALFHLLMKVIIYEPMMRTRAAREGQIEGRLGQAKKLADKAQQLKGEYEASIRKLREELHGNLQHAIAQAEGEAARLHAEARDQADKVLQEADRQLEAEKHTLQSQMDDQVAKVANSIAKNVVSQNFSAATQKKILAKIGG